MNLRGLLFVCFLMSWNITQAQISDLEMKLFQLPDVIFQKEKTPDHYQAAYKLMIKQPIDHKNPDRGHFYQKVYLSHVDFERPTVIITEGYNRNRNRIYELSRLLNANQLDVEHRFYGESMPDSIEYQFLTLEQATADLHRVNQIFREIYNKKWISTGISKGGQTTIYYRYFYPNDVDVSVPYVAPLNVELEETRIYDFLDTIGSESCRNKIYDVQRKILENRDESFNRMFWYTKGAQLSFSYLDFEEAVEFTVLEYPFSFWQWGGSCDDIPSKDASLDEVMEHFVTVSDIGFFSDRDMEAYKSHYYQAGTQMGYYSYEVDGFEDVLKALPIDKNPSAVFMPDHMDYEFNNSLPLKVDKWIKSNGNKFIYINGKNDTWSATAVLPSKKLDALWFFMEGTDHGQARIRNMNDSDRTKLINKLEDWLGEDYDDIFSKEK